MKVLLLLVAVLLVACSPAASASAGYRVRPVCGALHPSPETVPLDGFTVSWLLRCPIPRFNGPRLTQRAEGPATEVLTLLKEPNDPPPEACADYGLVLPDYVLVDAAGNAIQPVLPTDGCRPKKSVRDALDASVTCVLPPLSW